MDGNIKDTPPTVFVPAAADRPRWEALPAELADVRSQARRPQARRPGPSSTEVAGRGRIPTTLAASDPGRGPAELAAIAPDAPATVRPRGPSFEIGRRRRLREGPGVLLRRLDQAPAERD